MPFAWLRRPSWRSTFEIVPIQHDFARSHFRTGSAAGDLGISEFLVRRNRPKIPAALEPVVARAGYGRRAGGPGMPGRPPAARRKARLVVAREPHVSQFGTSPGGAAAPVRRALAGVSQTSPRSAVSPNRRGTVAAAVHWSGGRSRASRRRTVGTVAANRCRRGCAVERLFRLSPDCGAGNSQARTVSARTSASCAAVSLPAPEWRLENITI